MLVYQRVNRLSHESFHPQSDPITCTVMKRTTPPQTIMGHVFLVFDVHICSRTPPMKIIFLLLDMCTPHENKFQIFCSHIIFRNSNGRIDVACADR